MSMGTGKAIGLSAAVLAVLCGGIFGVFKLTGESPREVIENESSRIYVEELSFFDGHDRIRGTVYKPQDTTGRKPVLIYSHGLGQTGAEADGICRLAAGKGYVAYNFDFRGGGPSSRSSGETTQMSLMTEVRDLEFVIDRISGMDFAKKNRIFLIGHSMGGAVSALAAAGNPKKVEGAVLLAPALNLPDVGATMYRKAKNIPDTTFFVNMNVGRRFFEDMRGFDPYKRLRKFKGDVLIIQGSEDNLVNPVYAERASKEFRNSDYQLLTGVGHAFTGDAGTKMYALLGKYLDEHI